VILLPATALTGLTPEQWQAILAHELAHVRRSDYLINSAQTVVETLLFYHPAVWWVSGRIRLEREHCCDDLAVAACGDAAVYMQALAEMEQLRGVPEPALGVGGGSLVRRVRHLAGADDGRRGHLPQRLAGVVALTLIVASGMGICLGCRGSGTARNRAPRHRAMSTSRGAAGSKASRSPVPALIAKLKDENPAVRARAIEDLRQIRDYGAKEPAFQLVLAALKDEDSAVRAEAAEALPAFRDSVRVLNPLVGALRDPSANVRREAADALYFVGRDEGGFTPDPRVMEPLTGALTDEDPGVRGAAASSLDLAFGSYSEPGLLDPTVRSRAVAALIVCLRDDSFQVRVAAANALWPARDPKAVDPLIAALKDRDASVRSGAAAALGGLHAQKAVQPLISALKDTNAEVRANAMRALYEIYRTGGTRPREPIVAALKDSDPRVRSWAASILEWIGGKRAVGPLLIALGRQEPADQANAQARAAAALALGRIGDRRATPRLLDLLVDEDREVRRQAGWALGLLGDPHSQAHLRATMKGDDPRPREGAALALAFMGDDSGVEHLLAALKSADQADRVSAAADMFVLARERPNTLRRRVTLLIPFLNDPDREVGSDIEVALRDMHDARADEALGALVASRDARMRGMALQALGRMKNGREIDAASRALKDENPEVRMQAADVLKDAGDQRAVDALVGALGDEHWGVRAHAAAALRKLTGKDFGQDAAKWRLVQPTTALGITQHAGPFQVLLTTASSRFAVGRRIDFWVEVSKDEMPVRNARVRLSLEATGRAGFSAMLRAERDHYRGNVDLPAGGDWKATLDVTSREGAGSAKYSFNAR
jgi:HEAT repeat protein